MNHDTRRYYERRIRKKVGQAIQDFAMIGEGDRVIVAVSGGRDSLVMLKVLRDLNRAAPVRYELVPVHLRTGFEQGLEEIEDWVRREIGLELMMVDTELDRIIAEVSDPDKSACALCSRLRRGKLYGLAEEMGAASIALGHHMDDIVETFLLRCFYTGQMGGMAPARVSNDGKNRIIRPLAYCPEELVGEFFNFLEVAPVQTACPIRSDSKRAMIKDLLSSLQTEIPQVRQSIFAALGNIDERSLCLKGEEICACSLNRTNPSPAR